MGYPVSYRPAASPSGGGFQSPTYGNAGPPVMPSGNDNQPRAANDNIKNALKAANTVRQYMRWLRFMNPYLSAALTIWDLYDWYRAYQGQAGGFDMTGWTITCGSAKGRNTKEFQACTQTGWWHEWELPPGASYFGGNWLTAFAEKTGAINTVTGQPRWVYVGNARRPGDPAVEPAIEMMPDMPPAFMPMPEPFVEFAPLGEPAYVPAANPVPGHRPGTPLPAPKPLPVWSIPYRSPNPYVSPTEQPTWGPQPEPDPWRPPNFPPPRPRTNPRPRTRPRTRPRNDPKFEPFIPPRPNSQDPEPTLVEVLQPGFKNQYAYQSHRFRKPGPRVKEKKLYDAKGVWALYKHLGHATEINDFVDSFWKALPKKYRRPKPDGPISLSEKLWIIYKHWDEIDQWEAMKNYLDNAQEDEVVGFFHGHGAQGAVGLGATPLGPAI